MAAKHWLIGCGGGCGVLLLVCVGLFVAGGVWVKNATRGFENAVQTRGELDERFGRPGEFTPPADGAIPADRMEVFLAVREATREPRQRLAESLSGLPLSEKEARALDRQHGMEKARSVLGVLGSAFGMIGEIGEFCDARNRALLETGMGMGEYTYIHSVAYESWLGFHPETGRAGDHDVGDGNAPVHVSSFGPPGRVNAQLVEMLENQLRALPDDADPTWRNALAAERDAVERDRHRPLWCEGLPDPIAASLAPYRDRLLATWEPRAGAFELIRNRKRGAFSYTTD